MTEPRMPKDKPDLLSAIEREWKLLLNAAEKLTDKQMLTPDTGGWSPKDNFAHLTEWMKVLMGYHMDHRPSHEVLGVSEDVTKGWDMGNINPVLFERNRNRSRQDVLDEMKRVYEQLTAKLESMTFEDYMQPRHAGDPERNPLVLWIMGDTTDHFAEHRETIEKAIKESANLR
ncbi:MAG: ClbS/DfsB family four-helix bundle protein [Chloroflexi bacterium]|nr:ClbS/DfsB family four-helix bundle protein [Chloroflexota bacterium]